MNVTAIVIGLLANIIVSLIAGSSALAQRVSFEHDNLIFQSSPTSIPKQRTDTGLDSQPNLSPDGQRIASVHGTPGLMVFTGSEDREATELWMMNSDGTGLRRLLRGQPGKNPESTLENFTTPQFSPDGKLIYSLSEAWATSAAVHEVDHQSGRERFVCAGNTLEVIHDGKYKGHLIVAQHRYFLAGGSYDWIWLVTPDGRAIDPIGDNERSLEEFRSLYIERKP